MKERFIAGDRTVVAYDQQAKIAEPCKSAFDFPAVLVAAQPSTILSGRFAAIVAMRRDQVNSSCSQPLAQRVAVISAIGDHPLGFLPWSPAAMPSRRADRRKRFLREPDRSISTAQNQENPPSCAVPSTVNFFSASGTVNQTYTITTQDTTPVGQYSITITAIDPVGGTTASTSAGVSVAAAPNYQLSNYGAKIASPGASGSSTITVSPHNSVLPARCSRQWAKLPHHPLLTTIPAPTFAASRRDRRLRSRHAGAAVVWVSDAPAQNDVTAWSAADRNLDRHSDRLRREEHRSSGGQSRHHARRLYCHSHRFQWCDHRHHCRHCHCGVSVLRVKSCLCPYGLTANPK
jgi:hypothetical protein